VKENLPSETLPETSDRTLRKLPFPKLIVLLTGVAPALCCCLFSQGCGYTTRSTLSPSYQHIYVPAARNSTKEYDLQAPLTDAMRRKFTVDGRLRVVDEDKADLLLETDIKEYRLDPMAYDRRDGATEFRVTVVATARLLDTATGKQLWGNPRVQGTSSFMVSRLVPAVTPRGNTEFFAPTVRSFPSGNEGEAVTEALENLASQLLYLTVERW
jgi:hypothetical protein